MQTPRRSCGQFLITSDEERKWPHWEHTLTCEDIEAADRLELAWLDDDGSRRRRELRTPTRPQLKAHSPAYRRGPEDPPESARPGPERALLGRRSSLIPRLLLPLDASGHVAGSVEAGAGTAGQSAGLAQHQAEFDQATGCSRAARRWHHAGLCPGCVPVRMLMTGCWPIWPVTSWPAGCSGALTRPSPEGRT